MLIMICFIRLLSHIQYQEYNISRKIARRNLLGSSFCFYASVIPSINLFRSVQIFNSFFTFSLLTSVNRSTLSYENLKFIKYGIFSSF